MIQPKPRGLAFWRKPGESFHIGDVVVHVLRLRRGAVRVVIDAPPAVPVHRSEVVEEMKRERLGVFSLARSLRVRDDDPAPSQLEQEA